MGGAVQSPAVHAERGRRSTARPGAGLAHSTSAGRAQPKPSTGRPCACGGGCPKCQRASSLRIGAADAAHEREADALAGRLMRKGSEAGPVSPGKSGGLAGPSAPASVDEVLRSPGTPLDSGTRTFFESRLSRDLGSVRVHTDSRAQRSAREVNANAYTVGRDIVFASGQFAPATTAGRHLLAHELTHVLQQRDGGQKLLARDPGDENGNVSGVTIDCAGNSITFNTSRGVFSYTMNHCNVTPGEYEARVSVAPGRLHLNLGDDVPDTVNFEFSYEIAADQPNPSTFFGSQRQVHVSAPSPTELPGALTEIPIEFIAEPLDGAPMLDPAAASELGTTLSTTVSGTGGGDFPGYPLSVAGLGSHVLASGDFSWLSRADAASRVLSREYWSPLLPGRHFVTLDRLTNTLPRNLHPRIASELASGGPFSWVVSRGFTEAELRSIPSLVARLNESGVDSLSAAELAMLRRAAALHIGGATPGAPFASYSRAGHTAPFLEAQPPRYRVRMEIPRSAALDVSGPNAFTLGEQALTNIEEAEFLVVANHRGRIVSVQRIAESAAEPGFLMRHAGTIRWGGRVLVVAGAALSAYRIASASPEERGVVVAEEAGGQLGGMAGTALAVAGCAFFGVATGGIGLFVCGLGGGIIGGALGSTVMGDLARESGGPMDSTVCPSCHAMQRDWERQRSESMLSAPLPGLGLLPLDAVPLAPRPGVPGTVPLSPDELALIQRWLAESAEQAP